MLVENDDRIHHGLVNSALIFLTIHPLPVSRPASCLHNVFLPLLPPGLLVTPCFIDPPCHSTHPRFLWFHATSSRDSQGSSRYFSHRYEPLQSGGRGVSSDTNFGPWVAPRSHMSPSTHHSTCNTHILFLFTRNARSKQCHCVTSTVSVSDVFFELMRHVMCRVGIAPIRLRYRTFFLAPIKRY